MFALILGGAMAVSAASRVAVPIILLTPSLVPLAMSALLSAILAAGAFLAWVFGPLSVSGAEVSWILSSRLDRGELLHQPFWRLALVTVVAGAVLGASVWALVSPEPAWILVVVLAPGVASILVLLTQQGTRWPPLAGVLVAIVALVVVEGSGALAAAAMGIVILVCGVVAWCRLGQMSRHDLGRAAGAAAALRGSVTGADQGLVVDLIVRRTVRAPRRRIRAAGHGRLWLAQMDMRRLVNRQPWLLLVWVAVVDGCCLFASIAAPASVPWAGAGLMVALTAVMTMRRTMRLSAGARRNLPVGRSWELASCAGAIAVVAVNVLILAALMTAGGRPAVWAVAMAAVVNGSALLGAWRMSDTAAPDFSSGLVMTEAGAVPAGAALTLLRGWDVVVIIATVASVL
ncbi:DUF6297 family protein [Luteococcus sp. H138]|uniref:DUF6297 family protein n=1 Tax=unclassified Luteococcus TaxID=2639923 RepID=UPI00313AB9F7